MSKKGPDPESPAATALADISKQLFEQTDPLRTDLISRSTDFLSGGDVTGTPQFAALRDAANTQFGAARQNVLESMPTGGALIDALTGLESQRASTLTAGAGQLYGDELNRAFSLATGAPLAASTGGLSSAGNIQGQMAMAQAERESGIKEGIGRGVGGILGGK